MHVASTGVHMSVHTAEVGAGTDILKKTVASFCVPTSKTNVLIDMHAYDSFPAFYALEEL